MSTIQSDVQGNEQQKGIVAEQTTVDNSNQREPTARELAMDAISANRNKAFEEESGIKLAPADDAESKEAAAALADKAAQEAKDALALEAELEMQGAATNTAAPAKPAPGNDLLKQKVTVKINGVESEASIEELQRSYQKSESADRKLAVAAQRERELTEREAKFQEEVAAAQAAKLKAAETPAVPDTVTAKEFTTAMFDGDEAKATEAFNKAVSKAVDQAMAGRPTATQQQPIDIQQIVATVEQQFTVNSALKKSQTDYPELYADPDLEELAAAKIRRKQNDEGMSFAEALETTGTELAAKFGWAKAPGRQAKADTAARDMKLARKEELDPVAGIGVKTSTQEAAPLTNSQIIADMARQRGQGV